jgi:hypothetical protein
MGSGRDLSLGVKRPGREADESPPSNTEVNHGGAITPLPTRPSIVALNELSTGRQVVGSIPDEFISFSIDRILPAALWSWSRLGH